MGRIVNAFTMRPIHSVNATSKQYPSCRIVNAFTMRPMTILEISKGHIVNAFTMQCISNIINHGPHCECIHNAAYWRSAKAAL